MAMLALFQLLLLLSASAPPAQADRPAPPAGNHLLNAYHAPLSALTAPHSHYFLEFPISEEDEKQYIQPYASTSSQQEQQQQQQQPRCEDGSPYSFLFRRGTDAHVAKLLVEFEGASSGSSRNAVGGGATSTPWRSFQSSQSNSGVIPKLGTCIGFTPGFVSLGAASIGFDTPDDKPIFLRQQADMASILLSATGNANNATSESQQKKEKKQTKKKVWWEHLSGDYSNMHDWSYMFVPHCTPFTSSYAAANIREVMRWVTEQFTEALGGLDALVTVSGGGRIGGCSSSDVLDFAVALDSMSNSDTALSFAKYVSDDMKFGTESRPFSKALVVLDGSTLWNVDDPSMGEPNDKLGRSIEETLSSGGVEVAWIASSPGLPGDSASSVNKRTLESFEEADDGRSVQRPVVNETGSSSDQGGSVQRPVVNDTAMSSNADGSVQRPDPINDVASTLRDEARSKEDAFLQKMEQDFGKSFHVHRPSPSEVGKQTGSSCPRYAFPDMSAGEDGFSNFLRTVVRTRMPWGSSNNAIQNDEGGNEDQNSHFSFLSIFLIIAGAYLLSWGIYFLVKLCRQQRKGKRNEHDEDVAATPKRTTPTPHDVWFMALTKFPLVFLIVSIVIPVVLSYIAYAREGYTLSVNLDFDTYLDIDTIEERTAVQYKTMLDYQKESTKEEEENCVLLYEDDDSDKDGRRERFLEEMDEFNYDDANNGRRLQDYNKREGRTVISFFYQNRDGGTVFTPKVLESIKDFEEFLMDVPGFSDVCYGDGKKCFPFNSLTPYFFEDGELVDDIDGVLSLFPSSKIALAKMDKYFGKNNLGSNVTLTHVMMNDKNGFRKKRAQRFLESLHHELWNMDQEQRYPDLIISWSNAHMQNLEAADALEHDFKWSLAALSFIGLMVFVKVRNVFEVLAGVLGLVLAFTSALYWQYHFNFNQLTALHVAGIFVMLGVGADDIFLTIDTFDHTKVDYIDQAEAGAPKFDDPEIIKQRMVTSYKTAGSMLLVSSVTTAICFFSNIFSALVTIADFGSYMGMVVVLNYIHVMTILPSAILVYELHIKPIRRKIWAAMICLKKKNRRDESREPNSNEALDADTGVAGPSSSSSRKEVQIHEDEEVGDEPAVADTGVTTSSSQSEDVSQEESPETNATSQEEELGREENEESPEPHDDYKFLNHTKEMSALDRYLVTRHAPTIYKWRILIVLVSIFVAVIFGLLAWLNFSLYDGTIIVFKEKYNLGRVQRVIDQYFPEGVVQKYDALPDESEDDDDAIDPNLDLGGEGDRPYFPSGDVGDGSVDDPDPTPPSPTKSPTIAIPSSSPVLSRSPTPPDNQEKNTTSAPQASPPTASPISSPAGPGGTGTVPEPEGGWYPIWTGDNRGCFNDGKHPSYWDDNLSDTLFSCCQQHFANEPEECLETSIVAFKCDGTGFSKDPSYVLPNSPFSICIQSKYSEVEIDHIKNMLITQGDLILAIIENDKNIFKSMTTEEKKEAQNGVLVLTRVPNTVFDYGASVEIKGEVVVNAGTFGSLDGSYELDINLQEATNNKPPSPKPKVPTPPTEPGGGSKSPTGTIVQPPTITGTRRPTPTIQTGNQTRSPVTLQQGTPPNIPPRPSPTRPDSPSSPKWYPNWVGGKNECLDDGLQPDYISDNAEIFMFDTLIACCNKYYSAYKGQCLGIDDMTATPTPPPTRKPTPSPTIAISPSSPPSDPADTTNSPTLSPTKKVTLPPTPPPTKATMPPTPKPTPPPKKCQPGLSDRYCLNQPEPGRQFGKRIYYYISIVWGLPPVRPDPSVFMIRDDADQGKNGVLDNTLNINYIDPSEPRIQEWLLELATLARYDTALRLHPQLTWIEALKDFAVENGLGFPIPADLFIGVVEVLKDRSSFFRKLVEREIATDKPGIAGEYLFTSLSMLSEVPDLHTSEEALNEWTNFTDSINGMLPTNLPPVHAQGEVFLDTLRSTAIVESTLSSYFFANGLYLVIMLLFTGNLMLTFMVMLSLILILLCMAGLVFFAYRIEFGPVESLGVSIFVGLSANYLLHTAHSYHASRIKERKIKIQRAVFLTGSPILWSAISTIGGSSFLFACRTWLLTELGILICTIIALSLIFSEVFLLGLLGLIGPRPLDKHQNRHSCDLVVIFSQIFCLHKCRQKDDAEPEITPAEAQIGESDQDQEIVTANVRRCESDEAFSPSEMQSYYSDEAVTPSESRVVEDEEGIITAEVSRGGSDEATASEMQSYYSDQAVTRRGLRAGEDEDEYTEASF